MGIGTANHQLPDGSFTYILRFVPPEIIGKTREPFGKTGYWCLESRPDYDFGGISPEAPCNFGLPRDADSGALAAWVAEELGYPVALEADPGFWIKRTVFVGARPVTVPPRIRTPLYIVRPAAR
jgi:hypothetical protein